MCQRVRHRTILAVKIVQSIVLRRRVWSRTAGARPHLALGGVGMATVNVGGAQVLAGSLAAGLIDQGHHWWHLLRLTPCTSPALGAAMGRPCTEQSLHDYTVQYNYKVVTKTITHRLVNVMTTACGGHCHWAVTADALSGRSAGNKSTTRTSDLY